MIGVYPLVHRSHGRKQPLKVLIVDDEPAVAHALGVLFELNAIPCVSANSPDEALGILETDSVGVVIQDMNFVREKTTGEEGIELFHRIREFDRDIPVLLMTAWASLETAVQLIKDGATDYLAKPWDDDKLIVSVQNLLRMRRLQLENARLQAQRRQAREDLARDHDLCGLVYESDAMHGLVGLALNVAASDAPVLITGPSGAGKEKLAEILQANSRRVDRPFIRVNVGALPTELMEAELFGAEAGAFTGATSLRVGRFEAADGGTLFLDEIDALPLSGQVKLLRVVQSGEFQRLGSSKTRRADVRLISATNAGLQEAIREGSFREDLYYRLNVLELAVPPLEQRPDGHPAAGAPLPRPSGEEGRRAAPDDRPPRRSRQLIRHRWTGNVRELQNRMQRAVLTARRAITARGPRSCPAAFRSRYEPRTGRRGRPGGCRATRVEAGAPRCRTGSWRRAARRLGLSRQALYRKMDRLGIVLERRPRT